MWDTAVYDMSTERKAATKRPADKITAGPDSRKARQCQIDQPTTSWGEKTTEEEAPTLQVSLQNAKQIVEHQKVEITTLKEKVDMLTQDRDFLRERLKEALALKAWKQEETSAGLRKQSLQETDDSTSSQSPEDSEYSEEDDSSEDNKRKSKKKSKKRAKSKKPKKVRKMRVKTPDDSIRRYNMVLGKVQKEHISKAEAYAKLGVDRNTIVSQAPIAELAVASPDIFKTLRATFKRKDSLRRFAETCRSFCQQEPTATSILKKKEEGCLLDIYKNWASIPHLSL
ncbi:coiled-coil domain-containing protein 106-like [Brienomyrus brachyistius]|uniref:coiled-coil domain-containing protein 106-like n=1 Tax=Brienomyrus brachyistius TaxID=42636 RepID=UPI0020B18C5B|nr:coiled-coil domain-containing protein 106-like [Brienomyrus brachyistius]